MFAARSKQDHLGNIREVAACRFLRATVSAMVIAVGLAGTAVSNAKAGSALNGTVVGPLSTIGTVDCQIINDRIDIEFDLPPGSFDAEFVMATACEMESCSEDTTITVLGVCEEKLGGDLSMQIGSAGLTDQEVLRAQAPINNIVFGLNAMYTPANAGAPHHHVGSSFEDAGGPINTPGGGSGDAFTDDDPGIFVRVEVRPGTGITENCSVDGVEYILTTNNQDVRDALDPQIAPLLASVSAVPTDTRFVRIFDSSNGANAGSNIIVNYPGNDIVCSDPEIGIAMNVPAFTPKNIALFEGINTGSWFGSVDSGTSDTDTSTDDGSGTYTAGWPLF